MTKSFLLEDRDEAFIEGQLASGRYSDPSEVVRDALRLMEERETRRLELDAALDKGLADIEAGRVKPLQEAADRLIAKYQAMAESAVCDRPHFCGSRGRPRANTQCRPGL